MVQGEDGLVRTSPQGVSALLRRNGLRVLGAGTRDGLTVQRAADYGWTAVASRAPGRDTAWGRLADAADVLAYSGYAIRHCPPELRFLVARYHRAQPVTRSVDAGLINAIVRVPSVSGQSWVRVRVTALDLDRESGTVRLRGLRLYRADHPDYDDTYHRGLFETKLRLGDTVFADDTPTSQVPTARPWQNAWRPAKVDVSQLRLGHQQPIRDLSTRLPDSPADGQQV